METQDKLNTDFKHLIIGGGIAGLCLAYELHKSGESFVVADNQVGGTSSKIAAGMYNPVSGKRMTVSKNASEMLLALKEMMLDMERELAQKLWIEAPILQAFGSIKEGNDFGARLDHASFSQWVDANHSEETPLLHEFGMFKVNGAGWVKTEEWINLYQTHLLKQGKFRSTEIDYSDLNFEKGVWHWDGNTFENLIFCEGYRNSHNPWFSWLPFKLCKGQVLLIACKGLKKEHIIKRGVYLVHQYDDVYKVGASYEWNFEDASTTVLGKEELIEKVKQMIDLPFEVIGHVAGIRPTTRDRGAILGKHPVEKQLYIFNGLGTKGMLQAPYLAKHMAELLTQNTEPAREINIHRFAAFYSAEHSNATV